MKTLRHLFTHYGSLGGVQSIIKAHLEQEEAKQIPSSLVAFFDKPNSLPLESCERVQGLGWSGSTTVAQARRSLAQAEAGRRHHTAIFHDLWGLGFLADLVSCQRRVGAIHSHWPGLEFQLKQVGHLLDGVFCDSQALADLATEIVPTLREGRAIHLPVPINTCPPDLRGRRDSLAHRAIRLGFVGRVDFDQKRVERFLPLLKTLDQEGVPYTMEFLGSGNAEPMLKKQFKDSKDVVFHGRQSGQAYWRILGQWDCVLYTSDFEGSPLAMQEAMNAGCLPIFPKIGSGGDLVVQQVFPEGLYPPEDWAKIAGCLQQLRRVPDTKVASLREAAVRQSQSYAKEAYHQKFSQFWDTVATKTSVAHNFDFKPNLIRHIPFGILRRCSKRHLLAHYG